MISNRLRGYTRVSFASFSFQYHECKSNSLIKCHGPTFRPGYRKCRGVKVLMQLLKVPGEYEKGPGITKCCSLNMGFACTGQPCRLGKVLLFPGKHSQTD